MSVLITGGAGFVGSFTARLCAESGLDVVVLDNLSTGNRDHSRWGTFYGADVRHVQTVADVIASRDITTVVHLAASANVSESIANPAQYYSNNVSGAFALFDKSARSRVASASPGPPSLLVLPLANSSRDSGLDVN